VGLVIIMVAAVTIVVAIMLHMIHGAAIAFLEALAVVVARFIALNRGMLVHPAVIGVGVSTVREVATGSFHAIMKALSLRVAVVVGRAIPIAITILILTLGLGSAVLRVARVLLLGGSLDCYRGGHA
jgi:hypothetical protein